LRKLIFTAFVATLGLNLSAAELPVEMAAKLVKVVVSGTGGKITCRDGAMKTALESNGVLVDSSANIIWSSSPAEIKMLKSKGKLIITSRPEQLGMGAAIAIAEDGGRPKIYLHPANLAASGISLPDAVLKIGEKI